MKFDFKRYIIRVAKYLIYFVVLMSIPLIVFSIASDQPFDLNTLLVPGSTSKIVIIIIAFALFYPMIGFSSQNVYINNAFEQDREKIEGVFANSRYIVDQRTDKTISFRHSSSFSRLLSMYEDTIVLDFSENPLVLTGARKNVTRFARMITYAITERPE